MARRVSAYPLALVLAVLGVAWVITVSGQVFVGTPASAQFAAPGQPSTNNG